MWALLLFVRLFESCEVSESKNKANAFYMYCHTRILSDGMTYCTEE